jgi:hypothetical protein
MTPRAIPLHTMRTLLRMVNRRTHPSRIPVAVVKPGTGGLIAILERR